MSKKEIGCYMEDCIHLCACRRMSKIFGHIKGRNCSETCTAYQTMEDFIRDNDIVLADDLGEQELQYRLDCMR